MTLAGNGEGETLDIALVTWTTTITIIIYWGRYGDEAFLGGVRSSRVIAIYHYLEREL